MEKNAGQNNPEYKHFSSRGRQNIVTLFRYHSIVNLQLQIGRMIVKT